MDKNISIELNKELCKKLYIAPWARKTEEAVNKIAERYFYFISDEKKKIQQIFSEDELFFMCIVCKQEDWSQAEKLYDEVLQVVDSFDDEFYELSSLSKTQLKDKLQSLSILQMFALIDYIEEYWYQHDDIRYIEKICKPPVEEHVDEGDTRTPEQIVADICAQLKNKA